MNDDEAMEILENLRTSSRISEDEARAIRKAISTMELWKCVIKKTNEKVDEELLRGKKQ